jgi:hypothetical protein
MFGIEVLPILCQQLHSAIPQAGHGVENQADSTELFGRIFMMLSLARDQNA